MHEITTRYTSVKEVELFIKVGKHSAFKIDLIRWISEATKQSKSEVKRLFRDGAIDIALHRSEHDMFICEKCGKEVKVV